MLKILSLEVLQSEKSHFVLLNGCYSQFHAGVRIAFLLEHEKYADIFIVEKMFSEGHEQPVGTKSVNFYRRKKFCAVTLRDCDLCHPIPCEKVIYGVHSLYGLYGAIYGILGAVYGCSTLMWYHTWYHLWYHSI